MKILLTRSFPIAFRSDTVRLLRIPFSVYLMPVYFLALSQSQVIDPAGAIWTFVILHLFIYPASNGYNSYIDRDESSIGGLEAPPQPTRQLFYVTLGLDFLALIAGYAFLGTTFCVCLLAYIIASRAYSAPSIRLKKYPWGGFLTVSIFQGAFTYLTAVTGISGAFPVMDPATLLLMIAASAQIAGAYPLTQVYQHVEDAKRGDRTLSMVLGYRGTFVFSAAMVGIATACFAASFLLSGKIMHFVILELMFIPALVYFVSWFRRVRRDALHASFRETMRMSGYASFSMSSAFIILAFLNHAS
jgi:4-hydroxybenzoate polyprenyltransferase